MDKSNFYNLSILRTFLLLFFFISAHVANAQSLLVKNEENKLVKEIKVGKKVYIEFKDTTHFIENKVIIKLPLSIITTAQIDSLNDSTLFLHRPWMKAYTESGDNIINISAYSDLETDYSVLGISNEVKINDILLIKYKRKKYSHSYFSYEHFRGTDITGTWVLTNSEKDTYSVHDTITFKADKSFLTTTVSGTINKGNWRRGIFNKKKIKLKACLHSAGNIYKCRRRKWVWKIISITSNTLTIIQNSDKKLVYKLKN